MHMDSRVSSISRLFTHSCPCPTQAIRFQFPEMIYSTEIPLCQRANRLAAGLKQALFVNSLKVAAFFWRLLFSVLLQERRRPPLNFVAISAGKVNFAPEIAGNRSIRKSGIQSNMRVCVQIL